MAPKNPDVLLQGTLDMLALKALQLGRMHGWGITERIELGSGDVLRVGQGSLYPALYRLERQGCVRSSWGVSENNRRARFYELTAADAAGLPRHGPRGRASPAPWNSYWRSRRED